MSPRETDTELLLPLTWRAAIAAAVGLLVGAAAGYGAGHLFLRSYQARAVIRVATLKSIGPVMSMNELKARVESGSNVARALSELGEADGGRFNVWSEPDWAPDGAIASVNVIGPSLEKSVALCGKMAAIAIEESHKSFQEALQERGACDANSQRAALEQAAILVEMRRIADEVSSGRRAGEQLSVQTKDAELIDAARGAENPSKKRLLAAVGAFAGMFVGLAIPRPRARA